MVNRLKNINKKNLLLSLLIAVSLWIFVVYSVDPTTTRTYRDIEINFLNEETLESNGLAVASTNISTIDVTLTAKRTALDDISSDNISVYVDLSDAYIGENELTIEITVPSGSSIDGMSSQTITVVVEKAVTKTVSVEVDLDSGDSDDFVVMDISTEEVEVTAAASVIESVAGVVVTFPSSKLTDNGTTVALTPVAVDSDGNEVDFVSVSLDKISVTAASTTTKTVPLEVTVTGQSDSSYERSYSVVETVELVGAVSVLDDIDKVTASLDLSEIKESCSIGLDLDLPDGVKLADGSSQVTVSVTVAAIITLEIEIPAADIIIENTSDDFDYELSGTATIVLSGTSSEIGDADEDDFSVTVDASGLSSGTYDLTVSVTSSKYNDFTIKDSTVTLTVE